MFNGLAWVYKFFVHLQLFQVLNGWEIMNLFGLMIFSHPIMIFSYHWCGNINNWCKMLHQLLIFPYQWYGNITMKCGNNTSVYLFQPFGLMSFKLNHLLFFVLLFKVNLGMCFKILSEFEYETHMRSFWHEASFWHAFISQLS